MTGEGSAPPCMPLRDTLGLPRGSGRSLNTGLENAFLQLRGHGWEEGVHKSGSPAQLEAPPGEDKGAECGELTLPDDATLMWVTRNLKP